MKKSYIINLEQATKENTFFRNVLYTAKNCQLVVMSLKTNEEIGEEIHDNVDQFIRVESGTGKAVINEVEHYLADGFAVVIPAGAKHNIINTSNTEDLKLYTIYSPPEHKDGTIHQTKTEAQVGEEHFDGITSE